MAAFFRKVETSDADFIPLTEKMVIPSGRLLDDGRTKITGYEVKPRLLPGRGFTATTHMEREFDNGVTRPVNSVTEIVWPRRERVPVGLEEREVIMPVDLVIGEYVFRAC